MRHDYDLPQAWPGMTDAERNRWLTAERNRRQALRQDTPLAERARAQQRRAERKADARAGTVDVTEMR